MLKSVKENWGAPDRDHKLLEAVKFNQKVWSFFQAELSDPENPLPKNLREDILNLSVFIDKRLFEVLAYPNPDKLAIIIDIDFNIAAGLRTTPGQ
jgi:flagellar protein FlaF